MFKSRTENEIRKEVNVPEVERKQKVDREQDVDRETPEYCNKVHGDCHVPTTSADYHKLNRHVEFEGPEGVYGTRRFYGNPEFAERFGHGFHDNRHQEFERYWPKQYNQKYPVYWPKENETHEYPTYPTYLPKEFDNVHEYPNYPIHSSKRYDIPFRFPNHLNEKYGNVNYGYQGLYAPKPFRHIRPIPETFYNDNIDEELYLIKGWEHPMERLEKQRFVKNLKYWHDIREHMSNPEWNKVKCTLCQHKIQPLVNTEVLDCGHIYHQFCLKELFGLGQKNDSKDVFCVHCKHTVDPNLVNKLKVKFQTLKTDDKNVNDLKKYEI